MKRILLLLLLFCTGAATQAADAPYLRRFALIIGANDGGDARVRLRYAGSDARSMGAVFTRLGGIAAQDMLLLEQPSVFDILEGFLKVNAMIKAAPGKNTRTELVFYYSGHSDEKGLLLAGRTLPYTLLKQALAGINADIKIALLDSCSSGTLVRLKGGTMGTPFLHDTSMKMQGTVILTSSSHNEASQESDRIRGSFFTHYVLTGLRGAADADRDGRVTLNELYQFAYHQTLAVTEKTVSGPQHPNYSIQLSGSGDVVVTDIRSSRARLVLAPELTGTIAVRRANGIFVAELRKPDGIGTTLGMEPGRYTAFLQRGDRNYQADFTLGEGGTFTLGNASLRPVQGIPGGLRKGYEPPPVIQVPARFTLGFSPGFAGDFSGFSLALFGTTVTGNGSGFLLSLASVRSGGYFAGMALSLGYCGNGGDFSGFQASALWGCKNGRDFTGYQSGIIFAQNGRDFAGVQNGGFFSKNGRNLQGLQSSFGASINGAHLSGAQVALAWNRSGSLSGLQCALVNDVRTRMEGIQVGLVNLAGESRGVQTGLVNKAGDGKLCQIGLVNIGGRIAGTQIGLVNIADEASAPVGLVNIIRGGQFALQGWYDETGFYNTGLLTGGRHFYTLFGAGRHQDKPLFTAITGIGFNLNLSRRISLKADLLVQWYFEDADGITAVKVNGTPELTSRFRMAVEYRAGRALSLTAGLSLNGNEVNNTRIHPAGSSILEGSRLWPGWFVGINLF